MRQAALYQIMTTMRTTTTTIRSTRERAYYQVNQSREDMD